MENKTIMSKPLTLMKEDFVAQMVNLCNNSGLPFFVVEGVLKDLIQEVHLASQRQLESDTQKYNQELLAAQSKSDIQKDDD